MTPNPRSKTPLRSLTTYGYGSAPRHPDIDYSGDIDLHFTIHAFAGTPFHDQTTAKMVCDSVERCTELMKFRLYGFCLMPDHMHLLLSPADSGVHASEWLRRFKSFTTRQWQKLRPAESHLWQDSAHDHVCKDGETAESVLTYIVNNPVRAGLVECWRDWPWTRVFIEL